MGFCTIAFPNKVYISVDLVINSPNMLKCDIMLDHLNLEPLFMYSFLFYSVCSSFIN